MYRDDIQFGHDYIPNWPSEPGTIVEIIQERQDVKAIRIEFYGGGKRLYRIDSFLRNFKHYQNCVRCREIRNGEKK